MHSSGRKSMSDSICGDIMDDNTQYISELLNKGNEILVTDIANILSCDLDVAKSHLESIISTKEKQIATFYVINYVENGVFMCKKVAYQSLNDYPGANPSLYSIKLKKPTDLTTSNDIFENLFQKLVSAKSSDSIYIPISCNISVCDISIRKLSLIGSDVIPNTSSGTSFDLFNSKNQNKIDIKKPRQNAPFNTNSNNSFLKNETKISNNAQFNCEFLPIPENECIDKSNNAEHTKTKNGFFGLNNKQTVNKTSVKRDFSTIDFENKIKISPVKSVKYSKRVIDSQPEQNLFEQSDVELNSNCISNKDKDGTNGDDSIDCNTPESKRIIINEKVPKQSTYVENGYFVMEDYEEIIKVEKEVMMPQKSVANIVNCNADNVNKKRSQASITSFFKVLKK
ncbi:engA, GTP-binding protein [Babesia microti strain RI]|uniref:EngA, GTP-binding protein n=1 Tax=Babesia microti (strain RI) TaxID=1133968 RepID=I7IH80_BABMR|nr:engA, GTP-binding protein [Babesia microti strain RI]CCF75347.2 engA, GTP-binding protein [Babesia microti strain RI]|eukprot:XP_021337177.1 engA, GTP-binding protein [Babesia microti strain RI]